MKRKYFLALFLVLALFLAGCGGTPVSELEDEKEINMIVDTYLNAAFNGDYNTAKGCLHPDSLLQERLDMIFQQFAPIFADLHSAGYTLMVDLDLLNINISGDTAVATVGTLNACYYHNIYDMDCVQNNDLYGSQIMFKKYAGKWYVY